MKATTFAIPLLMVATLATPVLAKGNHYDTYRDGARQHRVAETSLAPRHTFHQIKKKKLSPRQVAKILKRKGFYNIRNMRFDGRAYQVKARSKRGHTLRLTINARNGNITHRTVLRKMRPVEPSRWQRRDNGTRGQITFQWHQHRTPFWMN